MPICPAIGCQKAITEGQKTAEFSLGEMLQGKKSGRLYHSSIFETKVLIHYECIFLYFNPHADAMMYDEFYRIVKEQVVREESEDIKAVVMAEAADDLNRLCPDCMMERSDPDTPVEEEMPPCGNCGSSALPICPDCGEVSEAAIELVERLAVA